MGTDRSACRAQALPAFLKLLSPIHSSSYRRPHPPILFAVALFRVWFACVLAQKLNALNPIKAPARSPLLAGESKISKYLTPSLDHTVDTCVALDTVVGGRVTNMIFSRAL